MTIKTERERESEREYRRQSNRQEHVRLIDVKMTASISNQASWNRFIEINNYWAIQPVKLRKTHHNNKTEKLCANVLIRCTGNYCYSENGQFVLVLLSALLAPRPNESFAHQVIVCFVYARISPLVIFGCCAIRQ